MKLEQIIAVRKGKTVYKDGNTAIKVYDESYSKADILNEALNQARIEETGLHIPKILEVGTVDGKWAIVLEYVSGLTLAEQMAAHPDKLCEYMKLFVSIQTEINSKKAPLLTTLKDKMIRKISYSDLEATVRYDLQLRLQKMDGPSTVCHCDFTPANIMLSDDGLPYILDWSHATQGIPYVDAAITYILFRLAGDEKLAQDYLDVYCEKCGIKKSAVLKWVPVAAASKSIKMSGEDKKFLLSLAASVEFDHMEE